jgi:hypothetical protein
LKRAYKKRRTHKRKAQLNRRKTQRGGFGFLSSLGEKAAGHILNKVNNFSVSKILDNRPNEPVAPTPPSPAPSSSSFQDKFKLFGNKLNESATAIGNELGQKVTQLREQAGSYQPSQALTNIANRSAQAVGNITAGTTILAIISQIIPTLSNAVFSLMLMGYLLTMFVNNPKEFTLAFASKYQEKFNKIKDSIQNDATLRNIMNRIEKKFKAGSSDIRLPPPTSNVGKSIIYNLDKMRYQGLIVGEIPPNEEYGEPMYDIWLKGGGLDELKRVRQNQPPTNPEFVFVPETDPRFIAAANNRYGQQKDTIESARQYYGLTTTTAVVPVAEAEQKTLLEIFNEKKSLIINSNDKIKTIKEIIQSRIDANKLKLEGLANRIQDPELKADIIAIKDAILNKITVLKGQVNARLDQSKI